MSKNSDARVWLALLTVLLTTLGLHAPVAVAVEGEPDAVAAERLHPIAVPSPGAELWRGVRGATTGTSQVRGPEAGVLISSAGQEWRALRNGLVKRYAGWALLLLVASIFVFHLIHGGVKLKGGRSGTTLARWSAFQRTLHWYTAILFIVLTVTGLSVMFGRTVIIPWLGEEAFGWWAMLAKYLHNYLGPPFIVGVLLTIVTLVRINLPTLTDVVWLLKGGGFIGKAHPSAGRVNAGEKVFTFWMMTTVGVVACTAGLVLAFPGYGQTRELMQLANLVHGATAVVWIFFSIGHVYLGTAGVEGTIDGMWTGRCDANWAKQHHDLWYEEVEDAQQAPVAVDPSEEDTVVRGQAT